jgi:hypothetical protein
LNTKDGKGTTTCCSQNPIGLSQPSHTKATGNYKAFSNIHYTKRYLEYLAFKTERSKSKRV